jgi:intracellular sulfur oxidation DsrE/DsrF family protein
MKSSGTVVLVTRNGLGTVVGADEAFGVLMFDKFVHALETETEPPSAVCFYTEGVRLLCQGSPALLGLQLLEGKGVRLIACQSCLERYGLREKLAVGEVGDMKQIVGLLLSASKVLTV